MVLLEHRDYIPTRAGYTAGWPEVVTQRCLRIATSLGRQSDLVPTYPSSASLERSVGLFHGRRWWAELRTRVTSGASAWALNPKRGDLALHLILSPSTPAAITLRHELIITLLSHYLRLSLRRPFSSRAFTMAAAPTFKAFTLAMIQLGQVGADKSGESI